jgi:hypothetical protein
MRPACINPNSWKANFCRAQFRAPAEKAKNAPDWQREWTHSYPFRRVRLIADDSQHYRFVAGHIDRVESRVVEESSWRHAESTRWEQ